MLTWLPVLVSVALGAAASPPTPIQSEGDEYTRYELLEPATAQFHIVYEVTATAAGSSVYFNPIRKGSEASGESVVDRLSGKPLPFEVVPGAEAVAAQVPEAEADTHYIKIRLPRPVPAQGEVRLLIEKTYRDPKSYFREGDLVVFSRSLSIKRNSVLLPNGYELVACNFPSQILSEKDGRLLVSFMNPGPAEAPLLLKARRLR
jgi:hypothetical protein